MVSATHCQVASGSTYRLILGRNADQVVGYVGHTSEFIFYLHSLVYPKKVQSIRKNSTVISMRTKPSSLLADCKASEERRQIKFITIRRNQSK